MALTLYDLDRMTDPDILAWIQKEMSFQTIVDCRWPSSL